MQKQYVAVELLREGIELRLAYYDELSISVTDRKRTCMYDLLGLVYEPVFMHFKNADLSEKTFNALYDNKEFVLRNIRGSDLFEKEDFEKKIGVLVNASSLTQDTYSIDKKTESAGFRILPLYFEEFRDDFGEREELILNKLLEMNTVEGTHEHVMKCDYIAFEKLILEIESGQISIEDIPFIYSPNDPDDILYGL